MVIDRRLNELIGLLLTIKTKAKMEDFLLGILTPKELKEIPMRLQIVKLLKARMPQQEIAEVLGVGVATVTRGSRELQKGRFKVVS